MTYTLD